MNEVKKKKDYFVKRLKQQLTQQDYLGLVLTSRTEISTKVCVSVNMSSTDGNRAQWSYLSLSHYYYIVAAIIVWCHCWVACEGLDLFVGVSAYLCVYDWLDHSEWESYYTPKIGDYQEDAVEKSSPDTHRDLLFFKLKARTVKNWKYTYGIRG